MVTLRPYEGIIRGDTVVLTERAGLPDGTPVWVLPQLDLEDQWLALSKAAQLFGASLSQLEAWVRSGKVRGTLGEPGLVNAGDVEDAVEQDDLLSLTMACAADEED